MRYEDFSEKWKFDQTVFGKCLRPFDRDLFKKVKAGCYLVVDDQGYLAYVGMSMRGIVSRVDSHMEKTWFSVAFCIADELTASTARSTRLERSLIRLFTPYANRERYIGQSCIHQDIWAVRTYGIEHPLDFLLGEIREPLWHADDYTLSAGRFASALIRRNLKVGTYNEQH